MKMTERERFCATMRFEPVDRLPNIELGLWGHTQELYRKAGMPEEAVNANFFRGSEILGLDRRDYVPLNMAPIPAYKDEVVEDTERYSIFRDGWGTLHKALKENTVGGTRASMDQYIGFAVDSPDDWPDAKRRLDASAPERYPDNWDERKAEWAARDYPLCLMTNGTFGFYSFMRRLIGTENLSTAFYDYPDMIHEMAEFMTEFFITLTTPALKQLDMDYFNFFEDMAYKTGPLISPRLFKKFLFSGYKRVIEHLTSHGVKSIWLDSDGNTELLLPMLIEAGVNFHWPLEAAAGMDAVKLRREYGRSLGLGGNIDKRELTRSKKEIDAELDRLRPLIEGGGFIPFVDHTVPPDIPYENFVYYMEQKQRMLEGR